MSKHIPRHDTNKNILPRSIAVATTLALGTAGLFGASGDARMPGICTTTRVTQEFSGSIHHLETVVDLPEELPLDALAMVVGWRTPDTRDPTKVLWHDSEPITQQQLSAHHGTIGLGIKGGAVQFGIGYETFDTASEFPVLNPADVRFGVLRTWLGSQSLGVVYLPPWPVQDHQVVVC